MNYHQKLEGLPTIHYPSLIEVPERRLFMQQQFDKYGITKSHCYVTDRYEKIKHNYKFYSSFPEPQVAVDNAQPGIICSFLHLIKQWYDKNEEEYAIFCDDDIEFCSIDYWSFSWKEFVKRLPGDWECVQLIRLNHWDSGTYVANDVYEVPELKIRERKWDDYGSSLLIRRSYAKQILTRHLIGENHISLDISDNCWGLLRPIIENVLFRNLSKVYVFPLLLESIDLLQLSSTAVSEHVEYELYNKYHIDSHNYFKELWINSGLQTNIKDMMNID